MTADRPRYVLVPVEPTEEMVAGWLNPRDGAQAYRAMIAASPPPGEDEVERLARVLAKTHGQDPDEQAPLSCICGPNNEPMPWWRYYEEDARAILAELGRKP